ncbi:gamma carbonic anhydrase family protein [Microvirga brassicacearum]|uniref:Gamma carbonic anhydrase family protein n=1 Tax=Microvirga brassicacearum TaxID=2580413 RepID=A0A5N3PAK2_9HYPH|nr:gamma carbonic anhydrase family protein [Microvirga brassicacearum]KAB0266778.1 gamma carbonic anhydrase family protein [Microvirga brassicacearum]
MATYSLGTQRPLLPSSDRFWLAPGAAVIGDVALGDDVSVWFGAIIRGDNERIGIGARSNIQDGAVLHSDMGSPLTIGASCTVGHRAILHGCTIGDFVLVGMGATVLNDAVIGANSIVGANALVTQGKRFEPNSLIVGSPAKAVRLLSDEEVASIAETSDEYVENYRRFAAELA